MDMLDRYLQAVKFFLPANQQDDIARELSENLISQMEDREEELGRPLDESEQEEILRRHGHPMLVAGRYRERQHLIGPTFFPLYVFVLEMGLGARPRDAGLVHDGRRRILPHETRTEARSSPGSAISSRTWAMSPSATA